MRQISVNESSHASEGGAARSALSPAAILWLEGYFRQHISSSLVLTAEPDGPLRLLIPGSDGAIQFDRTDARFLGDGRKLPFSYWAAEDEGWASMLSRAVPAPGRDSGDRAVTLREGGSIRVDYDILGLFYWMLSRREELDRTDLDSHGRFPASSSHAGHNGYLDRAVVDEWVHILRQVALSVWPSLNIVRREFRVVPTHDVDLPSRYAHRPMRGFVRDVLDDVVRRRRVSDALRAPWIRFAGGAELHPSDPANTFNWIMNLSEQIGTTSAFFFICGRTDARRDAGYEPEDGFVRGLMRSISARGHEIGLHPSYDTYRDPEALTREAKRLKSVCTQEGIEQGLWGGRMHYLRWDVRTTPNAWVAAGLDYDSTLGFADQAGFRCGTSHEYSAFDPAADRPLPLTIRPLIIMDCTITDDAYMGLGCGAEAYDTIISLRHTCEAAGGSFTILWHNSELADEAQRELYRSVLTAPRAARL